MKWWDQVLTSPVFQSDWVRYGLVGLAAAVVPFLVFLVFRPRPKPNVGTDEDASQHELVLGDLTTALAGQLPGGQRDQDQVLPLLRQGGFYKPTALLEYQAVRATLVLVPLVITLGASLLVDKGRIPIVMIVGLVLAMLGFSVPRVYLASQARKRRQEIERGLPVFADLLSIALLAGQSLLAGVRRVTDQLRGTFPAWRPN
jgi:tight adherence protein C